MVFKMKKKKSILQHDLRCFEHNLPMNPSFMFYNLIGCPYLQHFKPTTYKYKMYSYLYPFIVNFQ